MGWLKLGDQASGQWTGQWTGQDTQKMGWLKLGDEASGQWTGQSPSRKKWAGSSLGMRQVVSGQDRRRSRLFWRPIPTSSFGNVIFKITRCHNEITFLTQPNY